MAGKLTGAGGGGFALALVPPTLPEKILSKAIDQLEAKGIFLRNKDFLYVVSSYVQASVLSPCHLNYIEADIALLVILQSLYLSCLDIFDIYF